MTVEEMRETIGRHSSARRPHLLAIWLNAAQAAYESHGGVGPCPCWMCEWRRSYLYSIGRGDMVLVGSRYVPGAGRTFR